MKRTDINLHNAAWCKYFLTIFVFSQKKRCFFSQIFFNQKWLSIVQTKSGQFQAKRVSVRPRPEGKNNEAINDSPFVRRGEEDAGATRGSSYKLVLSWIWCDQINLQTEPQNATNSYIIYNWIRLKSILILWISTNKTIYIISSKARDICERLETTNLTDRQRIKGILKNKKSNLMKTTSEKSMTRSRGGKPIKNPLQE